MPRIYSAVYQPYTYEELIAPLQASTQEHKAVEKEYTDSMMMVDALRSRAEQEPNSPWAINLVNYANQLEGYANDLMQNGLNGTTRGNLMNMHSGFGKTVTPVVNALAREKELQAIRDKASGTRAVFGRNPTIQELIDNPALTQSNYSGENIYQTAKDAAAQYAAREIELFDPVNYNAYLYKYGKEQGFSNEEIAQMLENDPQFAELFGYIREQFGYPNDQTLTNEQINKLNNEIVAGALAGFGHDIDMKYNNRPDYMNPLQWAQYHKLMSGDENPTGSTQRHGEYFKIDPKYQNVKTQQGVVNNTIFDSDGNMKNDFKNFKVLNENGQWMDMDFMKAYKEYIAPLEQYHAAMSMYREAPDFVTVGPESIETYEKPDKPDVLKNIPDDKIEEVYQYYKRIGATKDTYNALKDLGVNDLSNDQHIQTSKSLNDYTNNLASLQYTTKILYKDYDDVVQALREYGTSNRNRKYSKDVYEVDDYLNQGKSVKRNSKLGFEDLKKDDITGMEFSLKSKDYIYINISGKGKFKVPVSFFDVELGKEIDQIYAIYQQMDDPNNPYVQQQVQDYIAETIEKFFKERSSQIYGKTVKKE